MKYSKVCKNEENKITNLDSEKKKKRLRVFSGVVLTLIIGIATIGMFYIMKVMNAICAINFSELSYFLVQTTNICGYMYFIGCFSNPDRGSYYHSF